MIGAFDEPVSSTALLKNQTAVLSLIRSHTHSSLYTHAQDSADHRHHRTGRQLPGGAAPGEGI